MLKKALILAGLVCSIFILHVDVDTQIPLSASSQSLTIVKRKPVSTNETSNMLREGGIRASAAVTRAELDSFLLDQMDELNVPGLAASVVLGDDIIWSGAYGYANIDQETEFTDTTSFIIFSACKPVVATALMQVYEDGLFQLDDDINDYLPFEVIHPDYPNATITPQMLLTHTSGIQDNWSVILGVIVFGDSDMPLGEFLEEYFTPGGIYYDEDFNFEPWAPGEAWDYSNIGTCVAAYLVEAVTGIPFDQYCNENIFAPLGMRHTSWFLEDLDINNVAMPYRYDNRLDTYVPYGHIGFPDYPDGQLRSSALDLANFLTAYVQYGQFDGVTILDSTTVDLTTTVYDPEAVNGPQGFMWYGGRYYGYNWWRHGGGYDGSNANIMFNQELNAGTVVLTNGDFYFSSAAWTIMINKLAELAATASPDIAINPTTVDVMVGENGTTRAEITITNPGFLDLTFQITETTDWLEVGPSSGSVDPEGEFLVEIMVDASTMSTGEYTAELTIDNNDPDDPQVILPVSLTVEAARVVVSLPSAASSPGAIAQVPLTMDNQTWLAVPVSQLDLECTFDHTLIECTDILPGEDAQHMSTFEWSIPGPGTLSLSISDDSGDFIEPGTGTIAQIAFLVDASAPAGGNADIPITDLLLKNEYGEDITYETIDGTITFGMRGDVTADGAVNIIDALAAVNIVIAVETPTEAEYWSADCNGDGSVNIVDVLGIVNVVLGTGSCSN
ncbi:MAG: serine hydrolase [Gemmatimonadota bacterium]|nr:MAG: serine hydrolase [Gemmatimonadota bacterium]